MRTRGIPYPDVQKAKFTPSVVWAYRMRGSMVGLFYTRSAAIHDLAALRTSSEARGTVSTSVFSTTS